MNNQYYEEYVELNGIKQYLLHYPARRSKAVVLYLHGGPGSSTAHFAYYVDELARTNSITIVYWDQRGTGKTYGKNKKVAHRVEIDEMVEDTKEVVEYLKKRYDVDKIVILGHSWGTVLGSQFVLKYPESVLAYVGVGQVVNMIENERVGYEKLVEEVKKANNEKDLNTISELGEYPEKNYNPVMLEKITKIRKLQSKYDLAVSPSWRLIRIMMKSPVFKWKDILDMMGSQKVNNELLRYLIEYDLTETEYSIPVYYILGDKDYQTPYSLGIEYLKKINAPRKKLVLVSGAGHDLPLTHAREFFEHMDQIISEEINQSKLLSK